FKAGAAGYCALLTPAVAGVIALAGGSVPAVLTLWGAAVGAGIGFLLPDWLLRAQAAERRGELRHALTSFLDLAVIILASGGGVQSALTLAAAGSDGWAFQQLRAVLDSSR